ncbi:hypothetical protein UFOVP395_1, partial [uncultured Caudovirales phage]
MAFEREEYKKAWDSKRQKHNTTLIQRWKCMKGCAQCGYKSHFAALCLDHIDPNNKDRNRKGSRAVNMKWGKERLKAELAKCQVLCTNCHQVRSWQQEHFKFRARIGST